MVGFPKKRAACRNVNSKGGSNAVLCPLWHMGRCSLGRATVSLPLERSGEGAHWQQQAHWQAAHARSTRNCGSKAVGRALGSASISDVPADFEVEIRSVGRSGLVRRTLE